MGNFTPIGQVKAGNAPAKPAASTGGIYALAGAPPAVVSRAAAHAKGLPVLPPSPAFGGSALQLPTVLGTGILGLLGTSPAAIKQHTLHPVAAAQGKLAKGGPTVSLGGKKLPLSEGVFPWPSPARAAAKVAGKLTQDAAAQAVAEASRAAHAQGFGLQAKPHVPQVEPGQVSEATGGEQGAQIRQGLKDAPAIRGKQQAGYSAERGRRAGAAENAMREQGGVAGYHAALGELKGELPKLDFKGFANFDEHALDELFNHVQQHPALRPYQKIATQSAILKAVGGKVPTASEQRLLERAFGREATSQIVESIPYWKRAKNLGLEVLNVPRAVLASFDLSAPFRQGLVAGVRYPRVFFKNFAPMVKAFGSERVYQGLMNDVYERETFPLMQKAKLAITDIGHVNQEAPLAQREEQFMSNLAERLPIVGHGIRASDRAYTGFLNKTRADVFDHLVHAAAGQGRDISDPQLLQSIARFVNSATGRGDLGALQKHAVTLNTLLFSPRLLASRLNFLNPVYYAKLDPFARREALRSARNLVGTLGLVLYLAKLGGATVNPDPRNADFAKIKIGNTRIDLAGGFQQPVRLLAQLFSGKIVSSTTGKTLTLGPQGPGKLSRRDIVQRFVEGKLSPVPSLVNDLFKGTDFQGKPFSWKRAAVQRMIPLLAQDAHDLYRQDGPLVAVGGYGLGAFGIGLQTYGPKPSGGGDSAKPGSFAPIGGLSGRPSITAQQTKFTPIGQVKASR